MDKLNELISKCKCGIYLEINANRDVYETVEEAIKKENSYEAGVFDEELAKRMIEKNIFISLQFYPDTPIGFYKTWGTSVEEVLTNALKTLDEEK